MEDSAGRGLGEIRWRQREEYGTILRGGVVLSGSHQALDQQATCMFFGPEHRGLPAILLLIPGGGCLQLYGGGGLLDLLGLGLEPVFAYGHGPGLGLGCGCPQLFDAPYHRYET